MRLSYVPWLLCCLVGCATAPPEPPTDVTLAAAPAAETAATTETAPEAEPVAMPKHLEAYAEIATRIEAEASQDETSWRYLVELCDDIGHRLSGSHTLTAALHWAERRLKEAGHEAVAIEPVMVPHWVRGEESATMTIPYKKDLRMLGLGLSAGSSKRGIEAEVIVLKDQEELERRAGEIKGKIVLFNAVMPDYEPETNDSHYSDVSKYRFHGPKWAMEKGAVGLLMRSVTQRSLHTPHTGTMRNGEREVTIPSAAITTEDADLIARLSARGKAVRVRLKMGAKYKGLAKSGNVVAELKGSEKPDEIVVIGGHIDSWDVGQGAHDNGSGVAISMAALDLLRRLKLTPRRTVRVVLWTNEENGLAGAKAYADAHKDEKIVAAFESDSGGAQVIAFGIHAKDEARQTEVAAKFEGLMPIFGPMGLRLVKTGFAGADVGPLVQQGVLGVGIVHDVSEYFDIHHTEADTIDKVKPADMKQGVAVMATLAYIIADMPEVW